MLISSQIKVNKEKLNTITNSKKQLNMVSILESHKYQPDENIKRSVVMNPFVV